eukprot:4130212-Pyramimonas_sp.AAC.1
MLLGELDDRIQPVDAVREVAALRRKSRPSAAGLEEPARSRALVLVLLRLRLNCPRGRFLQLACHELADARVDGSQ